MKKLGRLLFICLLFVSTISIAASIPIGFQWDANTDDVTVGYKIFMRIAPQATYNYLTPIKTVVGRAVTTSDFTLPDVPDGEVKTFYFVCRAYSAAGKDSTDSNEVSYVVDLRIPPAPKNFGCSKK